MNLDQSFKDHLSKNLFFIRGIAIFFVVLGHVIGDRDSGIRQLYETDIELLKWLYGFIYTFHVPIFLIASGITFVVFKNKKSLKVNLLSRLSRLIIPVLVWSPFYYIFRSVSGKLEFSVFGLINSVIQLDFIFWFFHVLLFASILSLIYFHYLQNSKIYVIISVLLFITSFYIEGRFATIFYWNIFYTFGVIIASYISYLDSQIKRINSINVLFMFFLLLSFMVINYQLYSTFYTFENSLLILKVINGLIGFHVIYLISDVNLPALDLLKIKFRGNLISVFSSLREFVIILGRLSMSIYLFHVLCGAIIRILLVKLSITMLIPQFTIGLIFSLIAPIVIYEICKTNKLFLYSIGEAK